MHLQPPAAPWHRPRHRLPPSPRLPPRPSSGLESRPAPARVHDLARAPDHHGHGHAHGLHHPHRSPRNCAQSEWAPVPLASRSASPLVWALAAWRCAVAEGETVPAVTGDGSAVAPVPLPRQRPSHGSAAPAQMERPAARGTARSNLGQLHGGWSHVRRTCFPGRNGRRNRGCCKVEGGWGRLHTLMLKLCLLPHRRCVVRRGGSALFRRVS